VPLEELLNFFVVNGRQWVTDQRNLLRPRAQPIAAENRAQLQHYFTPAILARAQCTWVDEIPNPEFYAALQTSGRQIPLDFRQMTGITFLDTIVIARSRFMDRTHWLSLLFHELVHVVQYHILGCDEFLTQYVYGWARNEFDYFTIVCAARSKTIRQSTWTTSQETRHNSRLKRHVFSMRCDRKGCDGKDRTVPSIGTLHGRRSRHLSWEAHLSRDAHSRGGCARPSCRWPGV